MQKQESKKLLNEIEILEKGINIIKDIGKKINKDSKIEENERG